ncbi:kinase-like domain-containing protein [Microdochium trichocladiopsis]|uniref:Kinase-like domain-containing protein n=1 Tax=Microdochium trichocladiopsis TaxID=1682393 RepID=A0A9P8XUA9_9PEZI|nr:kinase-like domain-containing protein [Microdochium trichocladiopsis]KAH7014464.1 kinase-like domain-containing protein [Microdochium trichocladiopsis]
MEPSTKLPYFCSAVALPAPLPTTREIESSTKDLPSIYAPDTRRNVLVGNDFVVKYGQFVQENEGHALLLLEKHAVDWVPRLYAMYRENEKLYLVLERKPGRQLAEVWDELDQNEISSVVSQLHKMFAQLRGLPPPSTGPRYANASGGPLRHRFFMWGQPDPEVNGPFDNDEQVVKALARRSLKAWEDASCRGWFAEYLARHLPQLLPGTDIPSVFTHADFQRKNIMVTKLPDSVEQLSGRSRYNITAVLDWEDAGWYPSYWEYACCFADFQWIDNWPAQVEHILEPCPREAAALMLIKQNVDF